MRILLLTAVLAVFGWPVAAQTKLSPRLAISGGSGFLVEFRPGADMGDARRWLLANGFDLIEHPDLRPNDLLVAGPRLRLREMVSRDDVAYVLPASPELVAGQRVIACAGAITEGQAAGEYMESGPGWSRDSSGAVALHYFTQSLTAQLEENAGRGEIDRAFREWQKYANLTLTPGGAPDAPRTIAIRFARRGHGDGLPFDGQGGTLAHTYYPAPPNPEPVAGDMHLDADENWHIGTATDLYTVVLHEAGHALGLQHSDQPGAVMYPYYRLAYGLTAEDIAGIQSLYGPPGAPRPAPGPITPPSSPPPSPGPPAPAPTPAADRMPPSVRIAAPATTLVSTTAPSLAISGTATDNVGVVAVKWTSSTGDSGTAAGTASWSAAIPLYVGNTVVTVRAYDAAGNSGWRALTVTRR